jgi:cytochrome c biogenesis protein CcdA/glutaredoxin
MNKYFLKTLFTIFIGLFFLGNFVQAEEKVEINFFYSDFCPYCERESQFLDSLEKEYPVVVNRYSVTSDKNATKELKSFYEEYQVPDRSWGLVPALFVNDNYFIGFNEDIKEQIVNCLTDCAGFEKSIYSVEIPFLGMVDTSETSLFFLTVVLGLLDGFNPCAMWVLVFLIALLINTKSRKKMMIVGGTFLFVSGLVYYLILNAWLKLFLAVSYVNIVRNLIGLLALGVGVWQIYNFINYKPGVCKVTEGGELQQKIRSKIQKKAEEVAQSSINFGLIIGIIVLAFAVNMVEFFCSAGVPAIFTQILSLNTSSNWEYQFYILLYTIIFMIDDLIIFLVAFFTLRQFGFTEKYNHWATLVGGILIFVIGLLLIFNPEMLSFG